MKEIYNILVVDDEFGMREGVHRVLLPYGHNIVTAENGKQAFKLIAENNFDLALIDLKLPDASGLEILDEVNSKDPLTVCVIITAYATIDTAVDATKRGAFDYLAKPFTADQLLVVVDKALDRRDLLVEADNLRKERDLSLLELSVEKTRFKTIISCMTDGVIVTNRDGRVVLFNAAGSKFLKDYLNIEPGTPIDDCASSQDIIDMVKEVSASDSKTHMAGREINVNNKEVWLANCAPIRDEAEAFLGTVSVFRDITRMKELEKDKTRFLSLVAHELKAPVAAIKGFLDIVQNKAAGDNPEVYDNMLRRSSERAGGLISLINDLLDMNRLDTKKVERNIQSISLKLKLLDNLEFFKTEAEQRGLKIINNIEKESLNVKADPDELNRIITNLLSNAIKYNKEEGSIIVSAGKKGDRVFFSIEDTGIGMSEAEQARLFEDFFRANNPLTRKQPGTGLGLAITRRMVEANFGRIEVDSQQGRGSKFTVILPAG